MSTTRGELIREKLNVLKADLEKLGITDYEMFDVETLDLADIVFLLSITFQGVDTEPGIKKIIIDTMQTKGVKPHEFGIELIYKFVVWFKELQ